MSDFLQKPEADDAPKSSSEAPWVKRVEYRSGKTPEGFAAAALPEQVKAGFTYYDKDQKANFQLTGFTASIVAILSGVSGTVPSGNNRYDNYWSSLVEDTRTQGINVYLGSGDNRVTIASGIYNTFKADLPDGVGYMKFAVCYLHETNECVLMELTASFENSIKEAIAAQTGQNPAKINVFNLFELSSKFWAIRFAGSFTKRTRDGIAWNGKGDMFFYPSLVAGVVLTEKFPMLAEISAQVTAYVDAGQKFVSGAQNQANQPSATNVQATPSRPPQTGFADPVAAPQIGSSNGQLGIPTPTRNYEPFPAAPPPEEIAGAFENVAYPDDWNN